MLIPLPTAPAKGQTGGFDDRVALGRRHIGEFGTITGVDDTALIDTAFAVANIARARGNGFALDLGSEVLAYKSAAHRAGANAKMAPVIVGNGATIKTDRGVQFDMVDDFDWSGFTFVSSDVFGVDPAANRADTRNGSSNMLIASNAGGRIVSITKGRLHCNFQYAVKNNDGSSKGEGFFFIAGFGAAQIDFNCSMKGCIIGAWINSTGGRMTGRIHFENSETCYLGRSGPDLILDLSLVNTPTQQDNYRPTSIAGTFNGKDLILIETNGPVSHTRFVDLSLESRYAVERAAYLQTVKNGTIRGWAIGSDFGKCTNGSENLTIENPYARLTRDGNPAQRYCWQCYGGSQGPCNKIVINNPVLQNDTGISGNKEVVPILGACTNITVNNPYGYDCGWGIWLVLRSGLRGDFMPVIDGVTFNGGRLEGPNGVVSANGAINVFNGIPSAGFSVKNVFINGTTSQPSSSGGTFMFRNIGGKTRIRVGVDGIDNANDFDAHVFALNCNDVAISSWDGR